MMNVLTLHPIANILHPISIYGTGSIVNFKENFFLLSCNQERALSFAIVLMTIRILELTQSAGASSPTEPMLPCVNILAWLHNFTCRNAKRGSSSRKMWNSWPGLDLQRCLASAVSINKQASGLRRTWREKKKTMAADEEPALGAVDKKKVARTGPNKLFRPARKVASGEMDRWPLVDAEWPVTGHTQSNTNTLIDSFYAAA